MLVLAIETSCDETAVAVVELMDNGMVKVLGEAIASSMEIHTKTGGIVPEVAAREQMVAMGPVIREALEKAKRLSTSGISSTTSTAGENSKIRNPKFEYRNNDQNSNEQMENNSISDVIPVKACTHSIVRDPGDEITNNQITKNKQNSNIQTSKHSNNSNTTKQLLESHSGDMNEIQSNPLSLKASQGQSRISSDIDEVINWARENVDAVAVTQGPGLMGSLLVGVETAKALALAWNKPLIPVQHVMAHLYGNWITPEYRIQNIEFSEDKNTTEVIPVKACTHSIVRDPGDEITNNQITKNKQYIKSQTNKQINNTIPQFPIVGLIVSGGHTEIILMKSHEEYEWLGGTRDDAAGECLDKCARVLGLPYPGGPAIAKIAENYELRIKNYAKTQNQIQNSDRIITNNQIPTPKQESINKQLNNSVIPVLFRRDSLSEHNRERSLSLIFSRDLGKLLPRPMMKEDNLEMSFSGLKTAVGQNIAKIKVEKVVASNAISRVDQVVQEEIRNPKYEIRNNDQNINAQTKSSNIPSFAIATAGKANIPKEVVEELAYELEEAVTDVLVGKLKKAVKIHQPKSICVAGGVSANKRLRDKLIQLSNEVGIPLLVPELKYCSDNAVMIGAYGLLAGNPVDILSLRPNPSMEL